MAKNQPIRTPTQLHPGVDASPQRPDSYPERRTYRILRDLIAAKVDAAANYLKSLKDVHIPAPTNNQVLTYNSSTSLWNAVTPAPGGDFTYTSTEALRPAPGHAGDLFLPSDGAQWERDTGAVWVPWGPIYPFKAPPTTGWSWVNQSTATVDTTRCGIYLEHPGTVGVDAALYVRTAPTNPYTVTAYMRPNAMFNRNYLWTGWLFRESSTGKFVSINIGPSATAPPAMMLYIYKFTDAVSFPASYFNTEPCMYPIDWWQINDDGANLNLRVSRDGRGWTEVYSISRTDFMAGGPNQYGFFVSAYNVPAAPYWLCGAHLLSFDENVSVYALKAAKFDGANTQYLYAADPSPMRLNGSSFTIAFWFNAADRVNWGVALAKAGAAATLDDYYVSLNYGAVAGDIGFFIYNGSTLYQPASLNFAAASTWYLWIGWVDVSGSPTINHSLNNGAANSHAAVSGGCNNGGKDFMLGTYGDHTTPLGNYLYAKLDSVGVWNRALTAGERTSLYNGGVGLSYWDLANNPAYASLLTNLKGWWDLDEASNVSKVDASGNGTTLLNSAPNPTQVYGKR